MNIIIVSNRFSKSRTISLNSHQLLIAGGVMLLIPFILAAIMFWWALYHAADIRNPYLQALVMDAQKDQLAKTNSYLQDNLSALAVRIGQMQAQLMRLDALGERLAKSAGIDKREFRFEQSPGRGGPEASSQPSREFSFNEVQKLVGSLSQNLETRADHLGVLETMMLQKRLETIAIPSYRPVATGWHSSNYGWRIDPFTGRQAFHEGVDFMAEVGTPILASAGGVVIFAGESPGYGMVLDIDHGNGLVSRYAHNSRLHVKQGDIVMRRQKIAEVGNSGRSTGPHLHFEVRFKGVPQDPSRYLQNQSAS